MIPMKCPACPERNYFGRLVDIDREPHPKCDNCKHALVVPESSPRRPK